MDTGVRAQVSGTQAGPVLVEHAQAGPDRAERTAPASVLPSQSSLGMPRCRPRRRGPSTSTGGRQSELRAALVAGATLHLELREQQPRLDGVGPPTGRVQRVGGASHRSERDPRAVLAGRSAGQHKKLRHSLSSGASEPGELALCPARFHRGDVRIAVQQSDPRQQQPDIGQRYALPLLIQRGCGLSCDGPSLCYEPDAEQQVGSILQQETNLGIKSTQGLLGPIQMLQSMRDVAPEGVHPAQVLLDESDRELDAELLVQSESLRQVCLGQGETEPSSMAEAAIGEQALEPYEVSGRPEDRRRGLQCLEPWIQPAELEQDRSFCANARARSTPADSATMPSISRNAETGRPPH